MSSSGIPRRSAIATPSPVLAWALEVMDHTRPKPPVANSTALLRKMCRSPVATSYAITPPQRPSSAMIRSTTWYSS
jgi:hypothetical protein